MPQTTKAFVVAQKGAPFTLQDVVLDDPLPDEVIVQVGADVRQPLNTTQLRLSLPGDCNGDLPYVSLRLSLANCRRSCLILPNGLNFTVISRWRKALYP